MEELKEKYLKDMINEAISLIDQMKAIRVANYPINDTSFLDSKDKEAYLSLYKMFKEVCRNFDLEIRELPHEEHLQMYNTHLPWKYNDMLKETQGMPADSSPYDEFELQKFFKATYNYGKTAVDNLIVAEYTNDDEMKKKELKTLDFCRANFKKHFWGFLYDEDLIEYEKQSRLGITPSESILDSYSILLEIYATLKKMATLILSGKQNSEEYETLFTFFLVRQTAMYNTALKLIPMGQAIPIDPLLRKEEIERNPEAFLNSYNSDVTEISKKLSNQRARIIAEITELDTEKEVDLSSLPSLSDRYLKDISTELRVKSRKKSAINNQENIVNHTR